MIPKKINYLNNKDILKEIHKSKVTYCWFARPDAADYDYIVRNLTDVYKSLRPSVEEVTIIDDETGEERQEIVKTQSAAKAARLKRLINLAQEKAAKAGIKLRADETGLTLDMIKDQDVVFRLMTSNHIPIKPPSPPKPKKGKKAQIIEDDSDDTSTEYDENDEPNTEYVKTNFPPFEHYQLNENGDLVCVGRSHWIGDLETGHFSRDHGRTTEKLGSMYMKMCDRYVTRSNWRGYTYSDEMKSQALLQLTQVGLQFDESKGQNPFAYYTTTVKNSFTRVLQIEKNHQSVRDDILELNNLNPSYTRQNQNTSYSDE